MDLHVMGSGTFSGDMLIAAVLDAFPRFEARVLAAIDAADSVYPVICTLERRADAEVAGQVFRIEPFDKYFGHIPFAFGNEVTNWESVQRRLDEAQLRSSIRTHALKIFESIIKAESLKQCVAIDRVILEERAAWSSVTQVVAAATLIDALEPARWSSSLQPRMAIDFTAAAILNHLHAVQAARRPPMHGMVCSGAGYGAGSNEILQLLCFEDGDTAVSQMTGVNRPKQMARGAGELPLP
jgi:Protein of unknown function DUF111